MLQTASKHKHNLNDEDKGGTIPWVPNHWGVPKSPNNVASTFFITAHLLPKDLRFEDGGAKLVSCPRYASVVMTLEIECLWGLLLATLRLYRFEHNICNINWLQLTYFPPVWTRVLHGLKFFVRSRPAPVGVQEILLTPTPHLHTFNPHLSRPNLHPPRTFSVSNPHLSKNY